MGILTPVRAAQRAYHSTSFVASLGSRMAEADSVVADISVSWLRATARAAVRSAVVRRTGPRDPHRRPPPATRRCVQRDRHRSRRTRHCVHLIRPAWGTWPWPVRPAGGRGTRSVARGGTRAPVVPPRRSAPEEARRVHFLPPSRSG